VEWKELLTKAAKASGKADDVWELVLEQAE